MLKDTLGLSEYMEGVGEIYPVKILEYEKFKYLANKYLMLEINNLKYEYDIETEETSFEVIISELLTYELAKNDLLVNIIDDEKIKNNLKLLKESNNKWEIEEFLELFKIILKKDVFLDEERKIIYIGEPLSKLQINKDNFEKFRSIVFRQNLLFLQLYYEDEILQNMLLDLRRQRMEKEQKNNSKEQDIEAIIQLICLKSNIRFSEIKDMTYYQLIALYSRLSLVENYEWVKLVQTSGYGSKDITIPKLDESINLNKHPEAFDFVSATNEVDSKIQG